MLCPLHEPYVFEIIGMLSLYKCLKKVKPVRFMLVR